MDRDPFRLGISRRHFLGLAGLGAFGLTACGRGANSAIGTPSTVNNPGEFNMYTWADYHAQANLDAFANEFNIRVALDVYDSNGQAIENLELSKGNGWFDLVVPSGSYVPQMIEKGLLQELDHALLPNLSNLDPVFMGRAFDPGNDYTVCKDWGTTGYVWDRNVVGDSISSWSEFAKLAGKDGVSGRVSMLASEPDWLRVGLWALDIAGDTSNEDDLLAADAWLTNRLLPHVRSFESYPVDGLLDGTFVLAQTWNGDGRRLVESDAERFQFAVGLPRAELWLDNYAIPADSPHVALAHAFINFMLEPEHSAVDVEAIGYSTGLRAVTKETVALAHSEFVFLEPEAISHCETYNVTPAQDFIDAAYNRAALVVAQR